MEPTISHADETNKLLKRIQWSRETIYQLLDASSSKLENIQLSENRNKL